LIDGALTVRSAADFATIALNRVTFGARGEEIARVREIGWAAWVDSQLRPPIGDEPTLAERLATQTMRIKYIGEPASPEIPGWPDMDQIRPLRTLTADVTYLWDMTRKVQYSVAANELVRIGQELKAATWIRNTYATYQLREFMADFWNTHFNIGQQADTLATAALPDFDQRVVRPNALGNFRTLVESVATSPAMLRYLNNASSTAAQPNENYARELLELHTMGGAMYRGIGDGTPTDGYTDQDITALCHALSGWTVEQGQEGPRGILPFSGRFIFNPAQHSDRAGTVLGENLSSLRGMAQGRRAIEMAAYHPATADFICAKLCRRIFGDNPPATAHTRAVATWKAHHESPDQIAKVLRTILVDGPEVGASPSKVRRPYERVIALFRTTNMELSAFESAYTAGAPLGDGVFVWPTPEGRPDTDAQWLSVPVNFFVWNMLLLLPFQAGVRTSLATEMPREAAGSGEALVEYWSTRMTGTILRAEGMRALIADANGPEGAMRAFKGGGIRDIEFALRRLVSLIATSPEFAMR